MLGLGALLLLVSISQPYWHMRVAAPQYPKGLFLIVYPHRLAGDVREIDGLNHYIGMRPLAQGAPLERRLAIPGLVLAAMGLVAAAFAPRRWAWWLVLPALVLPALFTADLYWWLRDFGLHLNPHAPLNRAVKPFIPTLLGQGRIAQFQSVAWFGVGFYLATAAGVLALLGLWGRFRSVKPARAVALAFVLIALGGTPGAQAQTRLVEAGRASSTLADVLASAAPGDTVIVRGGVHRGAFRIAVSLTLLGQEGAVLDGGGQGTVLTVTAPGSVIRGLTIRGSGTTLAREDAGVLVAAPSVTIEETQLKDVLFGAVLRRASGSRLRRNTFDSHALSVARRGDLIRVWYSDDVTIEENTVRGGRDIVLWFAQRLRITGNTVHGGRYGLHFMYCNDADVERNDLSENSVGVYLMYSAGLRLRHNRMIRNRGPSGYGLGLKDMEGTTVEENVIAENRVGVFLEHATGQWRGNVIADNDVGIYLFPTAAGNYWTTNNFIDNGEQVVTQGSVAAIRNRWEGNYWSDYRGFDADGDGRGDAPYRAEQLFERLTDHYPAFRFFAGSPAAQAVDFAARAFPLFAPRAKFADSMPRMRPLLPRLPLGAAGGR